MQELKYFSTFSGIGGFELGIHQAYEKLRTKNKERIKTTGTTERPSSQQPHFCDDGFTCVGYSEIDKYATQIYQKHFSKHKNYGDITKIDEKELPYFDLFVGGFPCQSFSIAGQRKGFEDTRGTMFFEIARIIREKQPRILLLENVKGLLSHNKGQTFFTIITALDELGYDCQWQVLNSKNHGVPQNRERVFVIGHLRGTSRPEVFPFTEESGANCQIIGRASGINGHDYLKRIYSPLGSSPTLPTGTGGNHEGKFEINGRVRRLTPTECERLQGFPDGWTEELSDTQRYKTLGNAVSVPVISDIITRLF